MHTKSFVLIKIQLFILYLLALSQTTAADEFFNEDFSENEEEGDPVMEDVRIGGKEHLRKSGRDDEVVRVSSFTTLQKLGDYEKYSTLNMQDLEVILSPGPMIAPDIIIRQFVDPKMTIDKMMEDLASSGKRKTSSLDEYEDTNSDIISDEPSMEENDIEDSHRFSKNKIQRATAEDTLTSYGLKTFTGIAPCRMKFNGTSGNFSLNFTNDCLILVTTPIPKSTVVLSCSPVVLANCSSNRDTLTVNLKGDMRFGRNSYVYCGPKAQIRTTSLRRRISIKIRKANNGYEDQTTECKFHTRKRRDLSISESPLTDGIGDIGLPSTATCGRLGRLSKIVGGRRVSPGLFPWVAQLDITRTDGTQTACTGSLVSPNYVLTAAHCLKNAESISVFLGGTDRHEFTGSEITVQAEKYILHRKWSPRTLTADIALVKLTDSVKYSEDVSPICLPKGKLRQESFEGRKAVAVGWGRVESKTKAPRQLYRVRLPFLDEYSCQRVYRRFFVPKIMVCTDSNVDAAICYGDSGGPLMYKRKERVYQIGVASFSLSKTCGASPDVFTHVREYVPWVESRIKQDDR